MVKFVFGQHGYSNYVLSARIIQHLEILLTHVANDGQRITRANYW